MALRDNLKKIREERKLTKKEVCERTGISERAYLTYEFGEREPKISVIEKLADFYGVTTDYLLGRPDAVPPADPVDEFADKVNMQEHEQIILKKWLALNEKQRQMVFDFMVDIVHEYEKEAVRSNTQPEQKQIKKTKGYNVSELAIARSSESNYKPAPTEEQYNSLVELTDDMLGE